MKIACECQYCGHRFEKEVYTRSGSHWLKCPNCGDTNVTVDKHAEKKDVFGYEHDKPMQDAYIKPTKERKENE